MQDPFALISKYFRRASARPGADGIAPPDRLAGLIPLVVTTIATLKIVPLSAAERQALGHKDPLNQRRVARGLLRLAKRRPALTRRAAVDPGTYAEVIDKDADYDNLYQFLGYIDQIVSDAQLRVRAAISGSTARAASFVHDILQSTGADPALATLVRAYLSGVDLALKQLARRRLQRDQRSQGKLRAGQAQAAEAGATLAAQPAVNRLAADAGKARKSKKGA